MGLIDGAVRFPTSTVIITKQKEMMRGYIFMRNNKMTHSFCEMEWSNIPFPLFSIYAQMPANQLAKMSLYWITYKASSSYLMQLGLFSFDISFTLFISRRVYHIH